MFKLSAVNICSLAAICFVALTLASIANAQYNSDSDDADSRPISQSELAKLLRNAPNKHARSYSVDDDSGSQPQHHMNPHSRLGLGQRGAMHSKAANLQFAPSYNNKQANYGLPNFELSANLGSPNSRSSSAANNDDDDDAGDANFNSNFDSNDDGQSDENSPQGRQNAASGRSDDMSDAGFAPPNFDSADFGPSDAGFGAGDGGHGRLRQAGSSSAALRNQFGGNSDDDASGIPAYQPGPNSAVSSDGDDDEPRGAMPNGGAQNDDDDD